MTVDLRPWCVAIPLFLTAFGCSDSGSGGSSRSASTASAVQTGTASGTGSGQTAPQAPPSQGNAIDTFNEGFQDAWDQLLPGLQGMMQTQAIAMGGSVYSRGAIDVEITNIQTVQSQMQVGPGLSQFSSNRLALRVPRQGTWELVIEADVRVTLTISSGIAPHYDIPVKISITNMFLEQEVDFDHSDPTRPVISRVGQPTINFNVQIDSTSSLLTQVTPVLTPLADYFAQQALNNALGGMLPTLAGMQGMPGPIHGVGNAPLTDSGVATPFAEIVANVDRKIRRDNLPYGCVLASIMDTPATDSWEDAYVNGGPGNAGTVINYGPTGDSAIFSGQYLASQAFRYAATNGDPDALDNLKHALWGVGNLLDVNGATGLLARNAAPQGSQVALNMHATYRSTPMNGGIWVSDQGAKGISRDQYSGVFFGLAVTYELVNDPQIKAECAMRIEMMLDYLITNKWVVNEDRPPLGTPYSRGPMFWAGIGYQKLTFLLMGHRDNPTKYAAEIAAAGSLSEVAWFGAWTSTLGVGHYYKFNLSHLAYYNYFRLETDQTRWQDFERAYRIIRRYVGHHINPHFDLVDASIDPSSAAVYFPQSREAMRGFLKRYHRELAPPVVDLSLVTFVQVTQFGYQNGLTSVSVGSSTTSMPSRPLDVELRRESGHFLWQRDPFSPATPNAGSAKKEKHGLDLVQPYWMGRYLGAF